MNIICENLLPIVRRITSELLMGAWCAHTHMHSAYKARHKYCNTDLQQRRTITYIAEQIVHTNIHMHTSLNISVWINACNLCIWHALGKIDMFCACICYYCNCIADYWQLNVLQFDFEHMCTTAMHLGAWRAEAG